MAVTTSKPKNTAHNIFIQGLVYRVGCFNINVRIEYGI